MEFNEVPHRDGWVEVSDDRLEQPYRMRLGVRNGRVVVVGLEIDNSDEVTTKTLRGVRLGAALDEYLEWMRHDHQSATEWDGRLAAHLEKRRQQGIPVPEDELERLTAYGDEVAAQQETWKALLAQLPEAPARKLKSRGPGAAPPSDEELQRFARIYLEELMSSPRGAVTRAANRSGMHRVTAHRWIAQCREAGYLPAEQESN